MAVERALSLESRPSTPTMAIKTVSSVKMERPSTPAVAVKAVSSIAMERAASRESRESTQSVEIKAVSSVGLVETETERSTPSVTIRPASSKELEPPASPSVAIKAASSVELKKSGSGEKGTPDLAVVAASSVGLISQKSEEEERAESPELKPVKLAASKSETVQNVPLSGTISEAFKPISPVKKPTIYKSRSGMNMLNPGGRQSRSLSVSCSGLGLELMFMFWTGMLICVIVTPFSWLSLFYMINDSLLFIFISLIVLFLHFLSGRQLLRSLQYV